MAFNLGDVLKNVSNSGTGREQITYLPIDNLDSDAGNFYELTGIDALADNISVAGLQQPIRVRAGQEPGRYTIVSGHRRMAACRKLAEENPEDWREVPCIIETDNASPALQQLRLIYANANTRQLTSAEMSEQAQQVEKLLYELKNEGYDFPGRMRDHVAEAVGASKTKLARLKVIRDKLIPDWAALWKSNDIGESQAYELSKLPADIQQYIFSWTPERRRGTLGQYGISCRGEALAALGNISCDKTGSGACDNLENMRMWIVKGDNWEVKCTGCCASCYKNMDCKYVCPRLAKDIKARRDKIKQNEAAKKQAEQNAAAERAAICRDLWAHFENARKATGISYPDLVKAADLYDMGPCRDAYLGHPEDTAKIRQLPYGFGGIDNFQHLIAVSGVLGCSTDYLLGLEAPAPAGATGIWKSGEPEEPGNYIAVYDYDNDGKMKTKEMYWNGHGWILYRMPLLEECTVYLWTEVPEVTKHG